MIARVCRWLLALVAAGVVVWSFARVGGRLLAELGADDRTEIVMLHWGDRDEDRVVANLVASFEAANPDIKIKRINSAANYWAKLQTMVASGDPPDVFFMNAYQLPKYAPKGIIKDVDPLLERDAASGTLTFDADDIIHEAFDGFRYDGEHLGQGPLYGLPMSFTPMGFYYNMKLFDEAGVAYPTSDWTWDDFDEAAEAITARTGKVGAAIDLRGSQLVRLMAWGEGTDLVSEDWRTVQDGAALRRVLDRVRGWRDRQGQDDTPRVYRLFGAAEQSLETSLSMFVSGDAAMQGVAGRWFVPTYRKIEDFEWGWAPMPRASRGANANNMLYIAAWCVSAKSEHPEEAWRIASYFASDEGQRINSELGLALPTLWSVARGPAFTNPDELPRDDAVFLDAVPGSRPMLWPDSRPMRAMHDAAFGMFSSDDKPADVALGELQDALDEANQSRLLLDYPPLRWGPIVAGIGAIVAIGIGVYAVVWWRKRPGSLRRGREMAGLLMASPFVLGLAAFVAGPMVMSLILSVAKWSGISTLGHAEFVGLENYREAFTNDMRFLKSLSVTALYAAMAVPLGQVASLGAALLMNTRVAGINFFRSAWYLPTVLAGVAMAVMWWWVFDTNNGLANMALSPVYALLGTDPLAWFGKDADPWGVVAFALASVWTFGGTMLIYLAGLAAIPAHLYEAARIDGAGPLRRFASVTIPMLSPVILFNVIIAIISSFQVFTPAFVMTRGGPENNTLFYVLLLYLEAFESHQMGYASALAWVLLVVVLTLTAVVLRLSKNRVETGG